MNSNLENRFQEYDWNNQNCYLQRKNYGEFLSSYIRNQKSSLVLNLNGEWGTGKTHFLRQLYTDLHTIHKLPTVYIDAWESDFSDDPLLVVLSEITDQLLKYITDEEDEDREKAKNKQSELLGKLSLLTKKIYNGSLDVAAAYISTKNEEWETGLDATALTSVASHLKINKENKTLEIDAPKYGKSLKENYRKQYLAIRQTKEIMNEFIRFISKDEQAKAFILIDELDRCRPSYAIEMLEIIKHFFETPNFVFVVATDTKQLSHSIKAVYGSGFNGEEYLTRFFNRTASIPKGDLSGFIKGCLEKTSILENLNIGLAIPNFRHNMDFKGTISKNDLEIEELSQNLMLIAEIYNISLRKLEQAIAKLDSILLFEKHKEDTLFDYQILFQLIIESSSDLFSQIYKERKLNTSENSPTFNLHNKTRVLITGYEHNTDINGILLYANPKNLSTLKSNQNRNFIKAKLDFSLAVMRLGSKNTTFSNVSKKLNRIDKPEDHIKNYQYYLGLYLDENQQLKVWTEEDYFSKVELASSLS